MRVCEFFAFGGEFVDVWGLELGGSVGAGVSVAEVVSEDEDYVGEFLFIGAGDLRGYNYG